MEEAEEEACSVLVESGYGVGIFGQVYRFVAWYELSLCLLEPHLSLGDPDGQQFEAYSIGLSHAPKAFWRSMSPLKCE